MSLSRMLKSGGGSERKSIINLVEVVRCSSPVQLLKYLVL